MYIELLTLHPKAVLGVAQKNFDDIVATLHKFRTSHMKQLVQRFILEQMAPEEKAGATGPAGTKLKVFLTKVRDDTPKAKVSVHKAHLQ